MKFLEIPILAQMTECLHGAESIGGESKIYGKFEAYSCTYSFFFFPFLRLSFSYLSSFHFENFVLCFHWNVLLSTLSSFFNCYLNWFMKGKRAGSDKKLYKSLDQQYQVEWSKSPETDLSSSPFGPLSESGSRRTLISQISLLNAAFPDLWPLVFLSVFFRLVVIEETEWLNNNEHEREEKQKK